MIEKVSGFYGFEVEGWYCVGLGKMRISFSSKMGVEVILSS